MSYSIGAYPAGSGTTATGDATFRPTLPTTRAGLFRTANTVNFSVANRFDAAGFTTESNTLYKEGAGIPALTPFSIDDAFYRNIPTTGGGAGLPQDTDNNSVDFLFVDTNGTSAGAGQRLGAPGPENLSGPTSAGSGVILSSLDVAHGDNQSPNIGRPLSSSSATNSTFRTISVRRTITHTTGPRLTRFSHHDPQLPPSGNTDPAHHVVLDQVTLKRVGGDGVGTTLGSRAFLNSQTAAASTATLDHRVSTMTPLINGGSINVQFLWSSRPAAIASGSRRRSRARRQGVFPRRALRWASNVLATATTPTNVESLDRSPCAPRHLPQLLA